MPLFKLQAGFRPMAEVETFIGDRGELFYIDTDPRLRISDGITPGGVVVTARPDQIRQDLKPFISGLYNLGSADKEWNTVFAKDLNLSGNLTVLGNISSQQITEIADFNIVLASGATNSSEADGAKISIAGTDAEISYNAELDGWVFSKPVFGVELRNLLDARIDSLQNNDTLKYDSTLEKWVPTRLDLPPLGWFIEGEENEFRTAKTFNELDATYNIRQVFIDDAGLLKLELARFTPEISVTTAQLFWDQPATSFIVSVVNPKDFLDKYIKSVHMIKNGIGIDNNLGNFYTSGPSTVPGPGIDWNQQFNITEQAKIYSNGSGSNGGSAQGQLILHDESNQEYNNNINFLFSWSNISIDISFNNLSGKNFLQSYENVEYTFSINGLSNIQNANVLISSNAGQVSNSTNDGTLILNEPIHKNYQNNVRTIFAEVEFTRPQSVTGSQYTVILTDSDSSINASFVYPSFYTWTENTEVPPNLEMIINGNDFASSVIKLGNQVKSIDSLIQNLNETPMAFWFAVRSSAVQPTNFKTGSSASLLSDVEVKTGFSIVIQPLSPMSDYIGEPYKLYGITLQPGNTYVRIS